MLRLTTVPKDMVHYYLLKFGQYFNQEGLSEKCFALSRTHFSKAIPVKDEVTKEELLYQYRYFENQLNDLLGHGPLLPPQVQKT